MRLGGPVQNADNPEEWARQLAELGYTAGNLPLSVKYEETGLQNGFRDEALKAGIVLAEVGAWSNPISTNEEERVQAMRHCMEQLEVADRIGAVCCVNIAGGRGTKWDGPHPDNLSEDTFALIVDSVRSVIDAVKPRRTFYTLEPMPWVYPYDADSYLRLIEAVDRPQFGVHLDPVNMISSVEKYFNNGAFLQECFAKLGPYIKSCHAKDVVIREHLTLHLDETYPGRGALDFAIYLKELNKLPKDVPLILEHLSSAEEYKSGADYIRRIAGQQGISL